MPIPEYGQLMFPLLELASDRNEHEVSQSMDTLATQLGVSPAERSILQPAGTGPLFNNRFGWAKTYLIKAGLLEKTRRGWFKITSTGSRFFAEKKAKGETSTSWQELDQRFSGIHDWLRESHTRIPQESAPPPLTPASVAEGPTTPSSVSQRRRKPHPQPHMETAPSRSQSTLTPVDAGSSTPEDVIAGAIARLDAKLLDDLESRLAQCDPTTFEILITKLMVKMGYANSEEDILQLHGFSGDGGIDGRVKRDALGLDQVYVQAKRWAAPVPLKPVTKFYETVNKERTRVGVFVARSGFNREAKEYIAEPEHQQNIAWIDGRRMAELMIRYRVGIREEGRGRFVLLSIDENAFELEQD